MSTTRPWTINGGSNQSLNLSLTLKPLSLLTLSSFPGFFIHILGWLPTEQGASDHLPCQPVFCPESLPKSSRFLSTTQIIWLLTGNFIREIFRTGKNDWNVGEKELMHWFQNCESKDLSIKIHRFFFLKAGTKMF